MKPGKRCIALSLKSALLAGILTIVSITLVACYIFIYINIRDTIIRQHQDSIVRSMELEGKSLQQFLENIERYALDLQYDSSVYATIRSNPEDDPVQIIKIRRLLVDSFRTKVNKIGGVNWICLILQDGSMVGASSKLTSYYLPSHPFAQTKDYMDILHHTRGCLWLGGYNDALFSQYPNSPYIASTYSDDVLLCTRRILVNTLQDSQNVLILAVDEDAIYSQMGIFTAAPFDNVCLFNADGDLVLCHNETQAGFLSEYYDKAIQGAASHSAIEEINGKNTHIVSMRLKNGWSILCTVPMQYYYAAIQPTLNILFGVAGLSLILINAWCVLLITQATRQLKTMTGIMEQAGANRDVKMDESGRIKEYNALSRQFNEMLRNIKAASADRRRMEIQLLQSQIKPHFLYNTMLSIRMMAVIVGAQSVADALMHLSDIIRPIFECGDEVWQVKQEIKLLDNYARLMELRFGKHAEYSISVDEAANELMVPRMLLQPLLENCYLHSIRGDSFITISIEASAAADGWKLRISDNGQGMSADVLNHIHQSMREPAGEGDDGIGIANVYYRLQKYYGDDFEMLVESEPNKGTSVIISLYRLAP